MSAPKRQFYAICDRCLNGSEDFFEKAGARWFDCRTGSWWSLLANASEFVSHERADATAREWGLENMSFIIPVVERTEPDSMTGESDFNPEDGEGWKK